MPFVERNFLQHIPEPDASSNVSKPFHKFWCHDALVVLGEPGAGKTTSFERAAAEEPDAECITVRNFLTLKSRRYPGKTLYLDGLDEQRSKSKDGTTILDELRQRLDELGSPRFRLSCRSADWYGSSDLGNLCDVAPSGSIAVISLEPLSENDIITIASERITSPLTFLEEATKRGIDELLTNPQTLDLILTVVKTNDWPSSRTELFEKACEVLLREPNKEHSRAHQDADTKSLAEAAGYLCTVILCGGLEGVALSQENSCDGYPYISELGQKPKMLRLAAQQRLFKGAGPEQRQPLHRTIAEFLAAKHLKRRIDEGLPLGRALSLLTGFDNGTLSDLRGVYAWLVCLCPQLAPTLIPVDPLGIVLYGDIAPLPPSTKRTILANLQTLAKRHPYFHPGWQNSISFGSLACTELVESFRSILSDPDESTTVKYCVLDAIQHGTSLPELADDMLSIAYSEQHVLYIRREAIQAYHKIVPGDFDKLLTLLDGIYSNQVVDDDFYLRGELLKILYPTALTPTKLAECLVADSLGTSNGDSIFLRQYLIERTSNSAIPELIEAIAKANKPTHNNYSWSQFVGQLLIKGLNLFGEAVDTETLYRWLSITIDSHRFSVLRRDDKLKVRSWFAAHHSRVLDLFEFYIASSPSDRLRHAECRFLDITHGAINECPSSYRWLFNKAATEPEKVRAEFYFNCAGWLFFSGHDADRPSLEELYTFVDEHPKFSEALKHIVYSEIPDWRMEEAVRSKELTIEEERRKSEDNGIFTSQLELIKAGSQLNNLNILAHYYQGLYAGADNNLPPYDRLVTNTNPDIAKAAMTGFHAVLTRDDLPTPEQIALARVERKSYYIGLPLLIGMGLISAEDMRPVLQLPDATLKSAIAFHYVERDEKEPAWLHEIIGLHPALATEAFIGFWKPQFKARCEHIDAIHELANQPEMKEIASLAALPLLSEFSNCHPTPLEYLLWAALQYAKPSELLELTRTVLSRVRAVRGVQRVLWLSAAFLISPGEFVVGLRKFVGNDKDKAYRFLKFTSGAFRTFNREHCIPMDHVTLGMIIEVVAAVFPPFDRSEKTDARVTNAENASRTIYNLIDKLKAMKEQVAGDVLKHLLAQYSLKFWREDLLQALAIQRQNCREAYFRYPTTQQVIETIHGGKPANVRDLKELVIGHVKTLRDDYRNGPLDGYKDFWNLDPYGRAISAIPENDCRDRLLGRLKPLLLCLDIQAEPEGHYAEDKRADIKVIFSTYNLPLEIKRHYHKDLWTAATEQLHARYSRDPGADGHGVYLIFWFGADYKKVPKRSDNTQSPNSAVELENMLRQSIPEEMKHYTEVIVLDCSRPKTAIKIRPQKAKAAKLISRTSHVRK